MNAPPPEPAPDFRQVQRAFAAHLRDPQRHAPPAGLEERRLKIYRELFYNNVEEFLANAFPVLRRITDDAAWHALVRDFYSRHVSKAPQFYRLAEEFLHFIEQERGSHPDDPPYIAELAHYEWVELALSVAEDDPGPALADPNGDPLDAPPVVSPLAWALAYTWPVHRIGPGYREPGPPAAPTYLVVHRTRQDEVRFMEINAVTARLLQLIQEQPGASGRALLLQIAAELSHPQPEAVVDAGSEMLAELRQRDIVLGTRRAD
jgi:uncharacterized protein